MSVINTMLRDLEARGDDARRPRIPVRPELPVKRKSGVLIGAAIVAVGAVAWQFLVPVYQSHVQAATANAVPTIVATAATVPMPQPSPSAAAGNTGANQSAVVNQQASALPQPAAVSVPPQAVTPSLHASWQWSNDGFALQLDNAAAIRYGIERIDAGTLKISLMHAALAPLEIATPTPSWIDSARVLRDGDQQTATIRADARLEYDVAMLDDGALVISVWRSAHAAAVPVQEAESSVMPEPANDIEQAVPAKLAPREYAAPRIDRSVLTPAQRDARQSAQAATQLRAGQTSQALTTLHAVVQSGDAAPKSAALLVTILMSQQRAQEARPYLDAALLQTPRDAALLKLKARMLALQGDLVRARDALAPLVPATSGDTELLALAASLAQQAHDFDAAANHYLQWTRIEPTNGAAWYGLALALDAQASSSSAIAAYQHALTLINEARLRDYATARITALQGKTSESVKTGAAVAR